MSALVASEGIVRLREYYRTSSGGNPNYIYYRHKYLLNALKHNKNFYGHIKINSLGFRNDEFSIEKDKDLIRIVAMGGSTTFDTYVTSNEKTWVYQLGELLQDHYKPQKIEVINTGVTGYRVFHSTVNLLLRVLDLQPDIIIVYHANNEITKNWKKRWAKKELFTEERFKAERYGMLIDFIEQHSLLFLKLRGYSMEIINKLITSQKEKTDRNDFPEQWLVDKFERELRTFVAICKENNIKVILPSPIVGFRRDMPLEKQKDIAKIMLQYYSGLTLEGLYNSYSIYNDRIAKVADESQSIYFELGDKVPGGLRYFPDGQHFSDEGASLMAKVLTENIIKSNVIELK